MTLENRLRIAADQTRTGISGLTPDPVSSRRGWPRFAVRAVAFAAVVVVSVVVVLNVGGGTSTNEIVATGSVIEATLQPISSLSEDNRVQELTHIDGARLADLDVRSLTSDGSGVVWITVADEPYPAPARTYSYDGREWRQLDSPYDVRRGVIAATPTQIWVDAFAGLAQFDGDSWRLHTPEDGAPLSYVAGADFAPNGDLWLYSIGLLVGSSIADDPLGEEPPRWEEHSRVSTYDSERWLHWEAVEEEFMHLDGGLAVDSAGSVWIASTEARWGEGVAGGVWNLQDGRWVQEWEPTKSLGFFSALAVDDDDVLWAAYREFVLRLSQDAAELLDASDGIGHVPGSGAAVNWRPTDIESDEGTVWVATMGGGISRFDGTTWQTYAGHNGLPSQEVAEIEFGPAGDPWLRLGDDGQRIAILDAR